VIYSLSVCFCSIPPHAVDCRCLLMLLQYPALPGMMLFCVPLPMCAVSVCL
jgi:hypothetical protein